LTSDSERSRLDKKILSFIAQPQKASSRESRFNELALELFRHQYDQNALYRRFCELSGVDPVKVSCWENIPALPTGAFKDFFVSSFPRKKTVRLFKTSGTTLERPGTHPFDTLKLYDAAVPGPFRTHLLADGKRLPFFFLLASPADAPRSSLSHMMGVLRRRFARGEKAFYVRRGFFYFEELVRDLKKTKGPVLILSTALGLWSFFDFLSKRKITLTMREGSRIFETGGFKGKKRAISKSRLYALCRERLGIPEDFCVSEYGMTELSSQFYDTRLADRVAGLRRKPIQRGPFWTRTLVIDPRTGRPARRGRAGLLRHFDLANRGSVVALQTEDLGRARDEGFELLGRGSRTDLRGCSLDYESLSSLAGDS